MVEQPGLTWTPARPWAWDTGGAAGKGALLDGITWRCRWWDWNARCAQAGSEVRVKEQRAAGIPEPSPRWENHWGDRWQRDQTCQVKRNSARTDWVSPWELQKPSLTGTPSWFGSHLILWPNRIQMGYRWGWHSGVSLLPKLRVRVEKSIYLGDRSRAEIPPHPTPPLRAQFLPVPLQSMPQSVRGPPRQTGSVHPLDLLCESVYKAFPSRSLSVEIPSWELDSLRVYKLFITD